MSGLRASDLRSAFYAGLIGVLLDVLGMVSMAKPEVLFTVGFGQALVAGALSSFATGVVAYLRALIVQAPADRPADPRWTPPPGRWPEPPPDQKKEPA